MTAEILVLQPSVSDPAGRVGDWLAGSGCTLTVVDCQRGEPLPSSLSGYAGLVVLGGEMGAYDDHLAPWLTQTKQLLREAADTDVATLAICLGHQLLAVATGGEVATAATPQQGLVDVGVTEAGLQDPLFARLSGAAAVHWNNDLVLAPPPGAVVLAEVDQQLQAFRLGTRVYGVQFHPEVDGPTVADWAREDVEAGRAGEGATQQRLDGIVAADSRLVATWGGFTRGFARLLQP